MRIAVAGGLQSRDMSKTDRRVDAYIQKSQPFARPILEHLRELVHETLGDEVEETIKWGMPFFIYRGDLLGNMAAFKAHAVFGFWKAPAMKDRALLARGEGAAMGHLGRMTSLKEMPSDKQLAAWLREAAELNAKGVKTPTRKTPKPKKELLAPPEFSKALKKNARATKTWEAFAPSHRKAYLEWITEAKTAPTREKRIATSIEWLAEGKSRMWKYEKKPRARRSSV